MVEPRYVCRQDGEINYFVYEFSTPNGAQLSRDAKVAEIGAQSVSGKLVSKAEDLPLKYFSQEPQDGFFSSMKRKADRIFENLLDQASAKLNGSNCHGPNDSSIITQHVDESGRRKKFGFSVLVNEKTIQDSRVVTFDSWIDEIRSFVGLTDTVAVKTQSTDYFIVAKMVIDCQPDGQIEYEQKTSLDEGCFRIAVGVILTMFGGGNIGSEDVDNFIHKHPNLANQLRLGFVEPKVKLARLVRSKVDRVLAEVLVGRLGNEFSQEVMLSNLRTSVKSISATPFTAEHGTAEIKFMIAPNDRSKHGLITGIEFKR